MKKLLFVPILFALLFVFSQTAFGQILYQQPVEPNEIPVYATLKPLSMDEILTHFRYKRTGIDIPSTTFPLVVQTPIEDGNKANYALIEKLKGASFQPFVITSTTDSPLISVRSNSPTSSITEDFLSDKNTGTVITYPVSSNGATQSISFTFKYFRYITANGLTIQLADNATLPTTVAISTLKPEQVIVVATKNVTSQYISFPETTASEWFVTFTYDQPLALSGLILNEIPSTNTTQYALRFLARPGASYEIYSGPDQYLTIPTGEAGNLTSSGITARSLKYYSPATNIAFTKIDTDADSIPDIRDNCPNIANEDQKDADKNNKGDACEDFDYDGIENSIDNCPDYPNQAQLDTDGDLVGDPCDTEESRLTERLAFLPWVGIFAGFVVVIGIFAITVKRHEK